MSAASRRKPAGAPPADPSRDAERLAHARKRLDLLYEVGQALLSVLDLDQLLDLIVRLAARHLKARKASLMLVEEGSDRMRINSAVGIRRWIRERTRITLGEGIAGSVAATGRPVLITDIATDPRYGRPSRGTYRTGSFLSVPLRRRERLLGVLNVSDKRTGESFDADDLNLVSTLAGQAAVAVENAVLYGRLRDQLLSLEELYRTRERERRRLLALIDASTDGILAADPDGRALFLNAPARVLLGIPSSGGEGSPLRELLGTGEPGRVTLDALEGALADAVTRRELDLSGPAGDRHLELVCLPVREEGGARLGALALLRDVTELKELDLARDDFMNRASHQLKTPVGLIRGFAEALLRNPGMELERRDRFLSLMHAEAGRLADLVERLLDFTRIESRMLRVELERVILVDLVRGLLPSFGTRGAEKGVLIEADLEALEPLGPLETDPGCVREALGNILDNALKVTPRGGRVTVSAARSPGGVEITVRDTGPGVDEGDLPRLFEKFFVGRGGGPSGTGLGLFIAQELLGAVGGTIAVDSWPGEGASFTIRLPLAPPAP